VDKHCPKTGKRCFLSESEVKRVMRKLSAALRSYRCPHCNYLHLTKGRGEDR